ncbi:hypothetical protein RHMOL_Rhmol07G0226000 [Rhododendron molle]|uniref:Uncharacterized protein n=3 Tax=Rhododendron molle TaxID=49168 RepID=A0ACC0N589_RHOML|nr:hypothetical protein RHMOL_Rhmol07G0226000 [Rhododendron molle]KAI8547826.1 hypothetical protein RHMOL_Rhmol07G0226000 [Rhododendron molle]KAI8547827.1 hypothetical protein RHMOL_Rhmol07G0226000 [Rhododendron molle]
MAPPPGISLSESKTVIPSITLDLNKSPACVVQMDRYQRVEKLRAEMPINENEIRITTQGRMWNYITYATTLLQKRNSYTNGKRWMNNRTSLAQREEVIRRTVYVSDIDHQVTEEQLAALFVNCGQVVDCRVCGDPNSVLRFAFIEFTDEEGARNALSLAGTMLGYYPVRVLPSKTCAC